MTPALYRKHIREVLLMAFPYPMTERALEDAVGELLPGPCQLSPLRDGIEWNLGKDFIRSEKNEDNDEEEWSLTKKGEAKAKRD